MNKRTRTVIIVVLLMAGAATAAWFLFLRGIKPAFFPSSQTVTDYLNTNTEVRFENTNTAENANAASNVNAVKKVLPTGQPVEFPLTLPAGFSIGLFAKDIGHARVLAFDPNGTLVVSITGAGNVLALPDANADGTADAVKTLASGLDNPHGLAFLRAGDVTWLYVAEEGQVSRYKYNGAEFTVSGKEQLFTLPSGGGHFTRTIQFGKDGKLYTTVGSSCNVCKESDDRRAAMLVSDADGKNLRVFARGLRNTVFFIAHPETGEWWGTDMGRDWLGDNLPPEDVNIIRDGKHYGWPYCYGNKVHDDNFDGKKTFDCSTTESPVLTMQAHSAPLGLQFIPASWGDYAGDLLISFHGSWNRSVPTGYKVVRVKMNGMAPGASTDFLKGFLQGSTALGRPVGLLFDTDGVLFISDDKADAVYRVVYNG